MDLTNEEGLRPASELRMRTYLALVALCSTLIAVPLLTLATWFGVGFGPTALATLQAQWPDHIALPFDLRYYSAFKLRRIAAVRPEIVAIGSSRAGGFTAEDFAPRRFYNFGFTAWSARQVADELGRVTQVAKPNVVILSLDYFILVDEWERQTSDRKQIHDQPLRYFIASASHFARTLWERPEILNLATSYLGIQAMISKEGFAADGAYHFAPDHIAAAAKTDLNARHLERSFFGGPEMSPRQKHELERIADWCKARHITLVAVQLPILKDAVDFLDHDERYYSNAGVWRDFEANETRKWLSQIGIHFFDLARSDIGASAENFIDSVHLSKTGMRRAMNELDALPDFRRLTR
ncbi:hydrolase [Bradyrhizobium sp. SRS-191]|uniref:hydrolase n=1 Tax=Bradyrhizobium sp. SRS-191 TaxID=2962606 RepID=UPI00211F2929|nr:hydrolase [Bradyrhizobium sp. SRS-191]